MSQSGVPSHVGLGGKQTKRVVCRYEKAVADFGEKRR